MNVLKLINVVPLYHTLGVLSKAFYSVSYVACLLMFLGS